MKLGLQIPYFTWPGGPPELGPKLAEIVSTAEDVGYSSIWVMDHFFQIPQVGPTTYDMMEAYTTLGFIAGHTSKARLGTMVTGVTYRHPGILVKQVTTLDVLSGGRANMGVGAAWFEQEHLGLGVPFPPVKERFERLDETLQIARQMWNPDNNGRFEGKHYQLAETLNVPQPLSKPHPPILVGGGGEKKTLRLVAKYADACNVRAESPEFVEHKLAVLREHCEREGRNYDDIEKTVLMRIDVGADGDKVGELVDQLGKLAAAGAQTVIGACIGMEQIRPLEVVGRELLPQVRDL